MCTPHQVITGALNKGENVYATGIVEGATFIACAVGSDVVILGADFSRVQVIIIPGCSHHAEQLVTSISCCHDSGKILNYQWFESQCFTVKEQVNTVLWNMDGLRMTVVIGDELFLYQHRSLTCISRPSSTAPVIVLCFFQEQSQDTCTWDIVWSVKLAQQPKFIKFSPDGIFLAVSGENDYLVKLFYQESGARDQLSFGFVTLYHPAPVRGLEWRRTGRYMPRLSVLITWCIDNTSRIWKETPPPELAMIDLNGDAGEQSWEKSKPRKIFGKHFRVKKARNKIINKLRGIMPEKRRRYEEPSHALGLRAQIGKSPSFSDLQSVHHSYTNIQFHLAATINAETDCMLVPSMENGSVLQKPLCVHWLNNKELVFSIGAEKLLAEALLSESEAPHNFPIADESLSSKDILDVKLEILLRQWSRSNDVLFTIHPVDGSLLIWTVEYLDDLHRQPVISFTSRFPAAFPITDAASLHPNLNTFNPHEPIYFEVLRREDGKDSGSTLSGRLLEKSSNTIHVLTNHENGSLNLWHMAIDDNSNFSTILSITHMSRMCGHRFQINQIVAHPVLPLLLTTSQFRASETTQNTYFPIDYKQERSALSEVILWKIAPVGPLCKSGGVQELARVASPFRTGFDCLGWIPVILPSCTLGTVCNSSSSCFIASDGRNLIIYQAVVDAQGLLSEIYNSTRRREFSSDETLSTSQLKHPEVGLLQQFNVVSTQSTAKPGCVLEVGKIPNVVTSNAELLLLHIFPERLVIDSSASIIEDCQMRMGDVVDRSKAAVFNDRYFVVIVERGMDYENMSELITIDPEVSNQENGPSRHTNVSTPSVAKLFFNSEKVCEQLVPLPSGVHILSVCPAAGHLSSSSLYPACQAPYVMITSCDDDVVRFWRCLDSEPGSVNKYEWREWNMISDNRPSELELEGTILSVSAAHSGRIACAYDPKSGRNTTQNVADVEIGVFECESSGGVEWMREDTFDLRNIRIPDVV
ncbi:hypothetical protein DICVIV_06822 [Dictyocaulus viviparus]|uniref:WD domain, G-beta repeat protein n=1 Tax=Dictyocaulus viviparus TaxID=29172 RepID=A0A0D8XTL6_DICVI|nr:hypothetical protein DICVIV_06822 [Dictyocaulus viviparus]